MTLPQVVERLVGLARRAAPDGADRAVVAVPTFVDDDGVLQDCPALPALSGVRLASTLAHELATPVTTIPDLAAAAVAEHRRGSGRGVERFLCVAIGTGVNAAAVHAGRLVDTAFGCLGDAGHVQVEHPGLPCLCGGRGCLESVASGWALARDGAAAGWSDARAVTLAARSGEPRALALLDRAGRALGRAAASWAALLWPQRIAVGGGVAGAGELLLAPARRELARAGAPYIVRDIELVPAELGAAAGLWGTLLIE